MGGNVHEWCLNEYIHPSHSDHDQNKDMRVLRGGSWQHNPEFLRTYFIGRNYPEYRYSTFGFRVVCLSPYSDNTADVL